MIENNIFDLEFIKYKLTIWDTGILGHDPKYVHGSLFWTNPLPLWVQTWQSAEDSLYILGFSV
ncbi:MAG: hypothetical protein CR994_02170 [Maribacter sp.]|nr:MAG: hypothetical protein CR994_02170 [Maribacter sp.]